MILLSFVRRALIALVQIYALFLTVYGVQWLVFTAIAVFRRKARPGFNPFQLEGPKRWTTLVMALLYIAGLAFFYGDFFGYSQRVGGLFEKRAYTAFYEGEAVHRHGDGHSEPVILEIEKSGDHYKILRLYFDGGRLDLPEGAPFERKDRKKTLLIEEDGVFAEETPWAVRLGRPVAAAQTGALPDTPLDPAAYTARAGLTAAGPCHFCGALTTGTYDFPEAEAYGVYICTSCGTEYSESGEEFYLNGVPFTMKAPEER